jgi:hypothetical protein
MKKEITMTVQQQRLIEAFHNNVGFVIKAKNESHYRSKQAAEMAEKIGTELNPIIVQFADELASFCATANDDSGPFDSQFCSDLEKLIVDTLMRNFHEEVKKGS